MKKILTIIPFFLAAMTLSFAAEGKPEVKNTINEAYAENDDASLEEIYEKIAEKQDVLEKDSTAVDEKPILSLDECQRLLDYTVEIKI
ncbi:MAG: hypothetical protein HN411_04610 [Waddliaceae bacterium]|jgi:hypothetical protein|nr:hypothetical protein [Waddliaceae bacterium]MBT3579298.1 hypothetical protein [Waddliaceae bacterium]MBT4444722.1 hypothetical protein [Waddliaceae bacterium]MBT6928433.1 hypothetical protein [Waddliaceae bacterium]MBT7264079.1 hypothetical protein [Waddliaceae bacterium]